MGQNRKIAFTYEVGVSRQTIDQISKLELELNDVNNALREAKREGDDDVYQDLRRQSQGLREEIKDLNKELRQQKKDFQDLSQAEGSIENLRGQYRILKRELDRLSETDPGFAKKSKEARALSDEIARLQKQSGNFFALVGRYEQEVGSALSATRGLLSGSSLLDLAAGFTTGGAILEGLQLVGEAGQAVIAFADQFREAERIVGATTRTMGEDLSNLTRSAIAVTNTYQLELNEVAQAQQQIQDNLGTGAEQTSTLLERSLLASADRVKTLSLINDEVSKLAGLGIPPDSALALITEASNRDINVDVLAEPLIRLREATPATVDALNAAFGPDATQELFETFREEPLEAIQQVSERLKELGPTSQVAGLLLADVFSSPGEDAIIAAQNISELATSLDDLIDPSNAYLASQQALFDANEKLAEQQEELTRKFNASGTELKTLGTELKAFGVQALNFLADVGLNVNLGALDLISGDAIGTRLEERNQRIAQVTEERAEAEKEQIRQVIDLRNQQGETLKELEDRIRGIRDQLTNTRPGDTAAITNLRGELVKAQTAADQLRKNLGLARTRGSDEASLGLNLLNKELAELNKQLLETDPENLEDVNDVLFQIGEKEAEIQRAQIALRLLKEEILTPLPATEQGGDLASALLDPIIRGAEQLDNLQLQGQVAAFDAGQTPDLEGLGRAAEIENQKQQEEDFLAFKNRMDEIDTQFKREQQDKQLEDLQAFEEARTKITQTALTQVGEASAKFLTGQTESFKDFAKEIFLIALTAAENQILLQIGVGQAQAIATKGPLLGGIEAAIITGLIKGLFAAVKSQIQAFGFGGLVEGNGFMIKGQSHSQGGVPIIAEGGEAIINKAVMASDQVITTTGTPYEIASQLNQLVPGKGRAFPNTQKIDPKTLLPVDGKRSFRKGGSVITVTGTPKKIHDQIFGVGGIVEGGEGFFNKKAMSSRTPIQVSGTPYQITKNINRLIPGKSFSYVNKGMAVPSGIYQEGGVLGVPQVAIPEQLLVPADEGSDQESTAIFSDTQIQFLASLIAREVGMSVKSAVGQGLNDANRRIEREILTEQQENI